MEQPTRPLKEKSNRNCLHCGSDLEGGGRSTRKYCSDSCKLAAFYSRKKEQSPVETRDNQAESGMGLSKTDIYTVVTVSPLPLNGKKAALNVTAETLNGRPETTLNIRNETVNGSKETDKGIAVRLNDKHNTEALEAEAVALSALLSGSAGNRIQGATPDAPVKEYTYKPVICPLLEEVADTYDHYVYQLERSTGFYQVPPVAMDTRWIDERLRAILEQVLSMAEQQEVRNKHLLQLKERLTDLMGSRPFGRLPPQYPFIAVAKMLHRSLEQVCQGMTRFGGIRLRIAYRRKVLLMAARYTLAGRVKKLPIEGFDFTGKE